MGLVTGGRRTKIVVDRKFQFSFTIVGIIYILAVAAFLGYPLYEMAQHQDTLLNGQPHDLAAFYKNQRTHTLASAMLFVFGILGAWVVFSLWRTHKIAGPLVKITRFVHQFATGNFHNRIVLRNRDQLQALAGALNDMAESLESRDDAIRTGIIEQIATAKRELYDTPGADGAIRALDQLAERVSQSFDSKWEAPEPEGIRSDPIQI